jgi:hypothetical protein
MEFGVQADRVNGYHVGGTRRAPGTFYPSVAVGVSDRTWPRSFPFPPVLGPGPPSGRK